MLGQRCPSCQIDSSPGDSYCKDCGTMLDSRSIVVFRKSPVVLSRPQLPSRRLRRVGVTVAVSAVALLAEVSLFYLRRRMQRYQGLRLLSFRQKPLPAPVTARVEEKGPSGKRVVTVYSERVVEERRWGRPVRRIVDRLAWRSEENLEL